MKRIESFIKMLKNKKHTQHTRFLATISDTLQPDTTGKSYLARPPQSRRACWAWPCILNIQLYIQFYIQSYNQSTRTSISISISIKYCWSLLVLSFPLDLHQYIQCNSDVIAYPPSNDKRRVAAMCNSWATSGKAHPNPGWYAMPFHAIPLAFDSSWNIETL